MASGKVSFGPYEFEPLSGRLSRRGYRLKLQPKPQTILTCLLECPGELVKREDLHKRLWPEGTFVDFDLGLNVAVRKLRDALDDSADTPIYVQTIPGEGYRFIAPVCGIDPVSDSIPPAATATTRFGRGAYWVAGVVAVAVLTILLLTASRSAPLNFRSRDWVLIAAFENRTGEKLLDGTLEYALERELSQSRYLNVAPGERLNDALVLMRQNPSTALTEDVARQVAVRDGGIKGVLSGRIEKFDQQYLLTVRLLNPASGEIVAAFGKEVNQGGLPDAVRSISDELRRKLGEKPLDSAAGQASRLEKATTPSLAALRAFSVGTSLIAQSQLESAAALFEQAIREDPQFASAHIRAANVYSALGRQDLATPHYQAAHRLAPGVTERERLFILGSYYQNFLLDGPRALAPYRALVSLYPDDYAGLSRLAGLYHRLGMAPERNDAFERVMAMRPNANLEMLGELWRYYRFDRPDKAKAQQYMDKARRLQQAGLFRAEASAILDLENALDPWRNGDVKRSAQEVARFSRHAFTEKDEYRSVLAMGNLSLGRIGAAEELCRSISEPGKRGECFLRLAYVRGDRKLARTQLAVLQRSGVSNLSGVDATAVAALFGETASAETWNRGTPRLQTLNGFLLLSKGRLAEAIKELEVGFPSHAPRTVVTFAWNRYALACVLERQGKLEEAIAKLEEVPASHSIATSAWHWLICRAKLADLYRRAHRISDAVRVEGELRHYLSEADADHPLVVKLAKVSASGTHRP